MCFANPAKSLELARSRLTPEQWSRFEREFDDFCVVQGMVDEDITSSVGAWAKLAFFQGRKMGATVPVNTGDRLTDEKANHIIARDGFKMTGAVLCKPNGERCIVEMSAVRWLSNDEMWAILHPVESFRKVADPVRDAYFEKIALAMMDDEQAEASLNRLINYEVEMREKIMCESCNGEGLIGSHACPDCNAGEARK